MLVTAEHTVNAAFTTDQTLHIRNRMYLQLETYSITITWVHAHQISPK